MAVCDVTDGDFEVETCEALALRRGIQIAMEVGFKSFLVEVDCLVLAMAVKKEKKERTLFGLIVSDICSLLGLCFNVSISHIRRNANKAAHGLANASFDFGELRVWLEEIPDCIFDIVTKDIH
ncbi:Serine hydroxymethyltransferase 2 [Bienertia sinuspersici]